ncbi:DUF1176 domain-containing protein [Massilia sp.]|uniref:DUF1176 domain-containing protein n=1 Tax=Massilia sp. TaxID=1882437 RepID=UPI0028B0069E|nr:DUF1176 domain-containing protein [Massilia sp.]
MKRHLLLPLSLSFLAAGAAAAETPGLRFEHGNWELACDNTRTCRAAGYHAEGASDDDEDGDKPPMPVSVLLTRQAGPHAPVKGELQIGNPGDEQETNRLPPKLDLTMRINGQPHGKVLIAQGKWTVDLAPRQTQALLAALTRDSRIEWTDGTLTWRLSDKGAAAVLLKMDEFQGRLGTPGALVRKGTKDENSVLPALPAPVVIAVVPDHKIIELPKARLAILRAALTAQAKEECQALSEPDEAENGITVWRLSGGKLLASTLCWRGAYNQGDAYWVINANPPYAPELVTTSGSGYADGVIDGSQKGRGIGDCWAFEDWTWDGKRFVHTSEGNTGECNGIAPGGAWSLPTLVTTVRKPGTPVRPR